jgi:hypothetical protein
MALLEHITSQIKVMVMDSHLISFPYKANCFSYFPILTLLSTILVCLFFSSILLSLLSYFPIVRFSMSSQMNMSKINIPF